MSDEPEIGPGVFGSMRGEWVRLVRDGSLAFISDDQLAAIAMLEQGRDPCQVWLDEEGREVDVHGNPLPPWKPPPPVRS